MTIYGNKSINSLFYILLFLTIFYMTVYMPAFTSVPGLSDFLGIGSFVFLFLYLLIYNVNLKDFFSFEISTYLIFLFYIISVGYIVTVHDKIEFINIILTFMQKSTLFIIIAIWVSITKSIKGISKIIVLNSILAGIISLINGNYVYGRLSLSLADNPNDLAYIMLSGVIALLLIIPEIKFKNSWLAILIIIFSNYIIFLTGSRKNLVISVICVFLYILFQRSKLSFIKGLVKYIFIIGIIIVVIGIGYSNLVQDSKLTRDASESDLVRIQMYNVGLDIFKDHPLFGVGFDGYKAISGMGTYSHSTYMEILANTGLFGFLLYFSIYLSIFIKYIKIIFRMENSEEKVRVYQMLLLFMIISILALAVVHTHSIISNILFGLIVGHTLLFKRYYNTETKFKNEQS
jgi:O-antigen ligase